MNRASLSFAEADFLAEQLCHHPADVGALADACSVAAVRSGHDIVRPQRHASTRCGSLLANAQVNKALDFLQRCKSFCFQFKGTTPLHV